jgi:type VI secretion system secreted protein VgrG
MVTISQTERTGRFISPAGGDVLSLMRFKGVEKMNGLGEIDVDLAAEGEPPAFDDLLGLHGTVEVETSNGLVRYIDGIIAAAEPLPGGNDLRFVRLTLRPWLWLATLRMNQRIFHNKTVPQILAEVLGDYAAYPHQLKLSRSYKPVEYVVQYGESDFAFVSRMMEGAGISYHFAHDKGEHRMVLTDTIDDLVAAPGDPRLYLASDTTHVGMGEYLTKVVAGRGITTGRVVLTDYNFKTPTTAMKVEAQGDATHAENRIESFVYPGGYGDPGTGKGVAGLRTDQTRAGDGPATSEGDILSVWPGMTFELVGAGDASHDGTYVLTEARHTFEGSAYRSGDDDARQYGGRYGFQSDAKPVVPRQVTPPARIQGAQTATVVGAGEIDCDEYGRILVKFHWDLKAAHSMRCRVAQVWAGPGWGGVIIPRIGMEVVVEFLEGDPDKPLVIGCVYNAKNMPPYPLPGQKTRSTWRSDTHGGSGFNEIRYEDQSGQEEIWIHAQKDMNEKVLNNHTLRADNNLVQSVGNNKMVEVFNNVTHAIGGGMTVTVGPGFKNSVVPAGPAGAEGGVGEVATGSGTAVAAGDMATTVEQNVTVTIGANETTDIGANQTLTVGAKQTETVGGDREENVGGNHVETIATHCSVTVGSNRTTTIGGNESLTVGGNMSVRVGGNYSLTVGGDIMITTGGATIILTSGGDIALRGKNLAAGLSKDVAIKANGKMGLKSSGDMTLKGSKIAHN